MPSGTLNGNCSPHLASSNLAPLIGTICYVTAALAIKTVIARFLVQRYVIGRIEWNDWLMLFALVRLNAKPSNNTDPEQLVALVNTSLITVSLYHGLGKH